jgi:hypothetical protein
MSLKAVELSILLHVTMGVKFQQHEFAALFDSIRMSSLIMNDDDDDDDESVVFLCVLELR